MVQTRSRIVLLCLSILVFGLVLISTAGVSEKPLKSRLKTVKDLVRSKQASLATTGGFVRYNSERLNRIESLNRYAPFFHSIHHSMPRIKDGRDAPYLQGQMSLTEDNYVDAYTIYRGVADYMLLLLNDYPEVTGMFYFHFDAWLDPAGFSGMNYSNIWFPKKQTRTGASSLVIDDSGPIYGCYMYDEEKQQGPDDRKKWPYYWWLFKMGWHHGVLDSVGDLKRDSTYNVIEGEICTGWSDFYHIPRRYFRDFIHLSAVFGRRSAFHESAIPTMLNIIDRTHRTKQKPEAKTAIDILADCWGSCCTDRPTVDDINKHRCGHRFDWLDAEGTHAVLSRLSEQQEALDSIWS